MLQNEVQFNAYHAVQEYPPPLPYLIWPTQEPSGCQGDSQQSGLKQLKSGCYVVECSFYDHDGAVARAEYLGTLRCEVGHHGIMTSGDLYVRRGMDLPNPSQGIPIFPRFFYRHYLRATRIQISPDCSRIWVNFERFSIRRWAWWVQDRGFRAELRRVAGPPNYPSREEFFQGRLFDESGGVIGEMRVGWVSPFFRKAVVEARAVEGVQTPQQSINDGEISLEGIFREVGWQLQTEGFAKESRNVKPQKPLSQEKSLDPLKVPEVWKNDQLHQQLKDIREVKPVTTLDEEWRYYLLCIPALASRSHRGLMFDTGFEEGNAVPREGAVLAARHRFAEFWGRHGGAFLESVKEIYFRTAVHELGHCMNLTHTDPESHSGFMSVLDSARRHLGDDWESKIIWAFSPQDTARLRHFPDFVVRPGGQPYIRDKTRRSPDPNNESMIEWGAATARKPEGAGLRLLIEPVAESDVLPLGAPVRIGMTLSNLTDSRREVSSIRLSRGNLKITSIGPGGQREDVQPLFLLLDGEETEELGPRSKDGSHWRHDLTLFRGRQGPLFSMPGLFTLWVEWHGHVRTQGESLGGWKEVVLRDSCSVLVQDAKNSHQASIAFRLLSAPDALTYLAMSSSNQESIEGEKPAIESLIEEAVDDRHLGRFWRTVHLEFQVNKEMRALQAQEKQKLKNGSSYLATTTEIERIERLEELVQRKVRA